MSIPAQVLSIGKALPEIKMVGERVCGGSVGGDGEYLCRDGNNVSGKGGSGSLSGERVG